MAVTTCSLISTAASVSAVRHHRGIGPAGAAICDVTERLSTTSGPAEPDDVSSALLAAVVSQTRWVPCDRALSSLPVRTLSRFRFVIIIKVQSRVHQ